MNDDVVESDKYIDDDVYTKTSKDQFIKNMLYISNTEMNLKEDENILIKIEVPEPGIVTLLHTFKSNLLESLLNPKNKEVFYMNSNSELYLNIPQGVKSLVHVNVISGKGFLGYENDEQSTQEISGKYSSMYLQSTENNVNRIKIKTEKDGANAKIPNISTVKESPKFKLPELSLKEQYQDLLNRKELILPPKYLLLLKKCLVFLNLHYHKLYYKMDFL